jgi:hypothetical protein
MIEWNSVYIPWYEPFDSLWCLWIRIGDLSSKISEMMVVRRKERGENYGTSLSLSLL